MSDPLATPPSSARTSLLDDSSADVTTQLPAMDAMHADARTVDGVDALAPETPAAFDAPEASHASHASIAPDATGEIEALDILEVVEVLRTSRIPIAPVSQPVSAAAHAPPPSRAAEVLGTSRLPAVMIAPRASLPSVANVPNVASVPRLHVAPTAHHPSSIAPLSLDVTPPSRASYADADPAAAGAFYRPLPADPRESTVEIARAAGIPSRASRIVVYTASVAGMCLVAGVLGVMLGYSHGPASRAQPTSLAAPAPAPAPLAPRVAVVTGAHEEITEGPILVPAKDAASVMEPSSESMATTASPAAAPAAPAPAPAPAVVVAPAPRSATAAPAARAAAPSTRSASSSNSSGSGTGSAAASGSSTGVLRLPANVTGVLIDGVPHKAGGGGLVVTCGRHTAKAPGHPSRLVIIPCGGSAAL